MKNILSALALSLALAVIMSFAHAQTVDLNVGDVPVDQEETTIQIKKGKSAQPVNDNKTKYEITEGQDDITGDGAVLTKPARELWKKACAQWKAELKENIKGNQILVSNCGSPSCSTEGNETICRSKANYKIKVKLTE